jgi:hypothetical protein
MMNGREGFKVQGSKFKVSGSRFKVLVYYCGKRNREK